MPFPCLTASSSCSLLWNTSRSTDSRPLPPCTSTEGPNTSCSFRQEEMADRTTINPHTSLVVFILCIFVIPILSWAPELCLKENPPFRVQRYKTNSIILKEAASRHRSPHTFPQAPAEEHRLTQRSNNRLHSKIAPLKRTYKKPLARRLKTKQYWSPIGAVLVAPSTSTGYYHGPVLVTSATSTG